MFRDIDKNIMRKFLFFVDLQRVYNIFYEDFQRWNPINRDRIVCI